MNESFYKKSEKTLIDKKDPTSETLLVPFIYETVVEDLKSLQPVFKDFFNKVISEQPDYLILLDKGARVFGIPFSKYLNDLKLPKKPKIFFWNDDSYKRGFSNPIEAQEALKKDFIDSNQFIGKKLFFIDETIYGGVGARMLQDFFERENIDGYYFALTNVGNYHQNEDGDYEEVARGVEENKRFTIYNTNAAAYFFPQELAKLYVTDVKNKKTNKIETGRRFEYVEELSEDFTPEGITEDKKAHAFEIKKKINDMIYQSLKNIHL